jgi:DNA modification methylase
VVAVSDCRLILGDCLDVLPTLEAGPVDAVVTDPPYGLEFMGKGWDSFRSNGGSAWAGKQTDKPDWKGDRRGRPGRLYMRSKHWTCRRCGKQKHKHDDTACAPDYELVTHEPLQLRAFQAWCEQWAATTLRVLKPGGYLLAFGGTRTYHRLACAVEDAGFEVRDCLMWLYGSGFPKGRGCLKPAWEPILLARRPGPRVLPLNVDACRVPGAVAAGWCANKGSGPKFTGTTYNGGEKYPEAQRRFDASPAGRYPANVVRDGSDEVLEAFAAAGEKKSSKRNPATCGGEHSNDIYGDLGPRKYDGNTYGDSGTASRFYFCAKASGAEREGSSHPTIKPVALMRWLVRLVTFPGQLVLDPFMGSGSTGVACRREDRRFVGVEKEPAYHADAEKRVGNALGPLFAGEVAV